MSSPPIQPQPEKKPQEKSNLLLLIIIVLCVLIIAAGILIGFLIFRDSEGEGRCRKRQCGRRTPDHGSAGGRCTVCRRR